MRPPTKTKSAPACSSLHRLRRRASSQWLPSTWLEVQSSFPQAEVSIFLSPTESIVLHSSFESLLYRSVALKTGGYISPRERVCIFLFDLQGTSPLPTPLSLQIHRPLWVGVNARRNACGAGFPGLHTMLTTHFALSIAYVQIEGRRGVEFSGCCGCTHQHSKPGASGFLTFRDFQDGYFFFLRYPACRGHSKKTWN